MLAHFGLERCANWWLIVAAAGLLVTISTISVHSWLPWTASRQNVVQAIMVINGWVSVGLFGSSLVLCVIAVLKRSKGAALKLLLSLIPSALNVFIIAAGGA